MRAFGEAIALSVAFCLATAVVPVPAHAQASPGLALPFKAMAPSKERKAYRAAYRETLKKPSDPDTLVRFAEAAIVFGDIESAISALERLLLVVGDQPDVRLELGVLYYRVGSRDAAALYLETARSSPDASTYVRERAEVFLKAIRG